MEEYLSAKFPVYAALVDGEYAGYVVCRVDSEVVWVESIFVKAEYRRHGVATALHSKAEEIAASYGDDTVYNYIHPNNHRMIEFLRNRGYTVLNLIEIRKPYKGEKLLHLLHDLQIDMTLRHSGCGDRSAVLPTVSGIQDQNLCGGQHPYGGHGRLVPGNIQGAHRPKSQD